MVLEYPEALVTQVSLPMRVATVDREDSWLMEVSDLYVHILILLTHLDIN